MTASQAATNVAFGGANHQTLYVSGLGNGMGGLQSGDDSFEPSQFHEGLQGLLIRGVSVLHALLVAKPGMFGPDCRIVEACRNAVRELYLAKFVLQQIGARALQNSKRAALKASRVFARLNAFPAGLDAHHFN